MIRPPAGLEGRTPRLRAAALLGLALLLGLCGLAAPPASRAASSIQMGYIGVSSDAGIFIALDKGYFKEQGLELSLERLAAGADQMALLGSGHLQIASGGISPTLFNAVNRGLPVVVAADKGSLRKGFGFNVFVVRKALVDGGQFKDLSDLRGRVLGSNSPASPVAFQTSLILKKGGLSVKDVKMEYMDFGDQPAAMANGKIDAAVMVEPFATATEARGIGKIVLPLDQIMLDFQTAVIFYNAQWARERPEDARRWMVAYVKALRYYNQSLRDRAVRDDVITILTAHTAIKDRAVYDKMIWPGLHPNGAVNVRPLLDYERWLLNEHLITQFVPPGRFIDSSYAEHAVGVLGPVPP